MLYQQPRFYRCREVTIINKKYATCSCGMPVRMVGIPCRHIMAVLKDYDIKMFGVRWLIQYQHSFGRRENNNINKLLHDLEKEQWKRDFSRREDIYVEGMLNQERFNI